MSQRPGSSPAPGLICALNSLESCGTRTVKGRQQLLDRLTWPSSSGDRHVPTLNWVTKALTGAPCPRLLLQIVKLRPTYIMAVGRVGVQPLCLGGHGKQKLEVLLRRGRQAGVPAFVGW